MLIWIVLIIVPMLFGLYAQMKIQSAYRENSQIPSCNGLRGAEAAQAVMESAGIRDVEIVEVEGLLTDHYDPVHKRLALSSDNYHGTSLAALGVSPEVAAGYFRNANYTPTPQTRFIPALSAVKAKGCADYVDAAAGAGDKDAARKPGRLSAAQTPPPPGAANKK